MDLINISDDLFVNADLIEAIRVQKIKGNKFLVLVIGGQDYTIEDGGNAREIMNKLLRGSKKLIPQFVSL